MGCDSAKEVAGKDTTGTGNAFFGYEAGNANTTGEQNTFIGYQAVQYEHCRKLQYLYRLNKQDHIDQAR